MKIYIICPVRQINKVRMIEIVSYVKSLEDEGHEVFLPFRDIDQKLSGFDIVNIERKVIEGTDRVDIFWCTRSKGSHVDLGMAIAFNKIIKLVKVCEKGTSEKCYCNVIKKIVENYNNYK